MLDFSTIKSSSVFSYLANFTAAKALIIPAKDHTTVLPEMPSLEKVIIPESVTSLVLGFFENCIAVNTVELKGTSIAPLTTAGLEDSEKCKYNKQW